MEFQEYIKYRNKITKPGVKGACTISCDDCPLGEENNGYDMACSDLETLHPDEAERLIKEWVEEHQVKTRQSVFLSICPNVDLNDDGVVSICPRDVDTNFYCTGVKTFCHDCEKAYWLESMNNQKENKK